MATLMRPSNRPVLSLREAVDRLFEQSFTPFVREVFGDTGSRHVPTNVWEDADNYYVHLLAPGVDPERVEITATAGLLTIAGEMASPAPEGARSVWQEWGTVQFRRQVQLPSGVDADRTEATYRDGVLTLRVPKPEQIKPKRIEIQAGA